MCSIATNATADQQLTSLKSSGDEKRIEKKLREFAGDSTVEKRGILDLPANHLHGMPSDLRHIRRIRAGRHRVFYTGHHTQCAYSVFFIKLFKKTGVDDELERRFHNVLRVAVDDPPPVRTIRPSDEPPADQS